MKIRNIKELVGLYINIRNNFGNKDEWTQESAERALRFLWEKQKDLCFLAEEENKIIGAYLINIKPWWSGDYLFDGEIFVDPEYQKQGIATELKKVVYKKAIQDHDVKFINLMTDKNKKHPKSWHEKVGFEENPDFIIMSARLKEVSHNLEK